jgi:hypothetical protein
MAELNAPHPDHAEGIQWEGSTRLAISPEDYQELWDAAHRASPAQQEPCKPVDMPVGFMMKHVAGTDIGFSWLECDPNFHRDYWKRIPLYAHPQPAAQPSLIESLRQEQERLVMPLIGPLLDAYDGTQKKDLADLSPGLVRLLNAINAAMEGRAAQPQQEAQEKDALDAARLDWLQKQAGISLHEPVTMPNTISEYKTWLLSDAFGDEIGKGATLREAIDAAMLREEGVKTEQECEALAKQKLEEYVNACKCNSVIDVSKAIQKMIGISMHALQTAEGSQGRPVQ